MKNLLTITTLYLLLSMSQAWSLPKCSGSYWDNCYGTWTYDDGAKYVGDWKDDKPNGQGTSTYADGEKYVGEYKDGNRHGQGTYTWANGIKYVGEWKDNKRNGQGTSTYPNGDKYVGEFKDDNRNGQGTYTFANGDKYVGEWKDDKKNGQGTYTRTNGTKYAGEFKDNKRHGQGTFTYADGRVWQGEFKDGEWVNGKKYVAGEYNPSSEISSLPICPGSPSYDGFTYWDNCIGTYTFPNGNKYVGEWKDDKIHGQGTFTYADGDEYVGEFKDGKRNGQGTFTWPDGDRYVGEFKDDKRHGQGTYTHADGSKYVGEWKDGMSNGQGTFTFPDGEGYVGEFKDDKYHGQGTLTYPDGEVWQGQWRNDDWVSGNKYAAGENNPPVKENNNNNKQNIDSNDIINAASGSGFVVSSSGHIVTNNHVINGCNEVKVHYNGEQYKASIISKDDYNDLALIKATFSPSTVFTIKNGNAELMEDIYVAGYPFGDLFNSSVKITKGIVSSLSGFQNNFSNMQIDAALQPGNSGGPVIDYQGNVVGVAVAKLDLIKFVELFNSVPENTNFAIKSSVLLNFLNSNGLKTKKASEQIMARSELSEKITQGTLYLSCWMTYARIEEMKSQKVLFNNIIK